MRFFVSKLFPFVAGICSISLIAAQTSSEDSIPLWIFRSVLAIAVGIIAWFLKGMVDDSKKDNRERDEKIERLLKVTTAHEVMYRFWLEEMSGNLQPETGQRQTDKIHRLILSLADKQKDG